jgi:hypothetical protein
LRRLDVAVQLPDPPSDVTVIDLDGGDGGGAPVPPAVFTNAPLPTINRTPPKTQPVLF